MPRLLHTADWQIGKPYRWVDDPERRSRLQRARMEAVERIIELVDARAIDAVLVAGDLFDSSTVDGGLVMEVLELLGSINTPVLVIPGNHDHGGAGVSGAVRMCNRRCTNEPPISSCSSNLNPLGLPGSRCCPVHSGANTRR